MVRSAVREECLAVRDAAGILDLPGFSRFRIAGTRRTGLAVDSLITGMVPKPGRIGLGYFADAQGRIVTEMSIMAMGEDFFFLITAATAQLHDYEWLVKHLPAGAGIKIEDVTEAFLVPDPDSARNRARSCRASRTRILSKPWLTHQSAQVEGIWCQLVRVSFRRRARLGDPFTKTEDTPEGLSMR
jgi:dimethylglycine dehydrogenase